MDNRVRVIANFHVSVEYKDDSCNYFSETKRMWSDETGKVTEDVIDEWEAHFIKYILKENYNIRSCNVICTSFFKLDDK